MKQFLFGRLGNGSRIGTAYTWFNLNGSGNVDAVRMPVSVAGTLRNFRVQSVNAIGGTREVTYRIQKNGADTDLACTLSDAIGLAVDDVTHSVTVAPGDDVRIKTVNSTSVGGTDDIRLAVEFDSDAADLCWFPNGTTGTGNNTIATCLHFPFSGGSGSWSSTLTPEYGELIPMNGAITRYDVVVNVAPGTGKSNVYALQVNGVIQDGSGGTTDTRITIANSATAGTWTGSLALSAGDYLHIRRTPTNSPAATATRTGIAFQTSTPGLGPVCGVANPASWTYLGPPNRESNTEALATMLGPVSPMTIQTMYIRSGAAPGDPEDWFQEALRINGADEGPVVRIAGTSKAGSDAAHPVRIESSDLWAVKRSSAGANMGVTAIAFGVASCVYTVDPTAVSVRYVAGTQSIAVDANDASCVWTATSNDPWITVADSPPGDTGDGSITVSYTQNPTASVRVGTVTVAGQTVTITQAANPLYTPCPTVELATTLCGIREFIWWTEWANWHAGTIGPAYGCIDLADPPGYYGGWKEGRALSCSPAARALSGLDGAYEGGYFSVTLADHDRAIRHILRTSAPWGRSARGDAVNIRLISDEGRRALAEPAVIATGVVEGTEFNDDLSITLRCRDGLAMTGYDGLVPVRLITLADFPNCPADNVGKRVPIVYGTVSDGDADTPVGAYEPLYVGLRTARDGNSYHAWVIAGHAIYGGAGFGCFVDGVSVPAFSAGGHWSWPGDPDFPDLVGSPAEHFVDINGHRYTILYGTGPEADDVAGGSKTVRLNLQGISAVADGSGDLIDSYPLQVAHALQNWLLKPLEAAPYETGDWHIPKWVTADTDNGVCVVAIETFEALAGSPPAYTGGGFVIGAGGEAVDAREIIGRLALQGGFHIGHNNRWQAVAYRADLTTPTANLPLIDELTDDLIACEVDEDALADRHATNARYSRTRRYGTLPSLTTGSPPVAVDIQEWLSSGVRRDATGADEYGDIPTELELEAAGDDTWALEVADYWLRVRRHPPRIVRITGPLCLYSTYDVGDTVQVRHTHLVTEATSAVIRGVIHRVVIDAMRGTCRLDLWDLTDTFSDGA